MKYIKKYESRDLPKLKELYKAILIHNNKKVEELINSGMDINQELNIPPWIYGTPLFWAITEDNVKAVKLLLDAGSNPNFKTKEGNCPINIVYNHEMIKYLIDAGADWNKKNNQVNDFLDYLNDKDTKLIIKLYPNQYNNYKINTITTTLF